MIEEEEEVEDASEDDQKTYDLVAVDVVVFAVDESDLIEGGGVGGSFVCVA